MSYTCITFTIFVSFLLGACDNGGFSVDPAPNSVSGVKCSESADCVTLDWEASNPLSNDHYDIVGYRIYYGTNSPPVGKNLDVGIVTTAEIRNLPTGYYFFSIYALYKTKNSDVVLLSTRTEAIYSNIPVGSPAPPPTKPESGETTVPQNEVRLPVEALKLSTPSTRIRNTFATDLTAAITLVTKAYSFTTPKTGKNFYTFKSIKYDTSKCQTNFLDSHIFLLEEKGGSQEIYPNQILKLNPETKYRIQVYIDHVTCTKLSGDLVFRKP